MYVCWAGEQTEDGGGQEEEEAQGGEEDVSGAGQATWQPPPQSPASPTGSEAAETVVWAELDYCQGASWDALDADVASVTSSTAPTVCFDRDSDSDSDTYGF